MKDWLTQALRKALAESASTLSLAHLTPYAPSVSKCMQMATEAIEGEKALLQSESELSRLRQKLGLTAKEPPTATEALLNSPTRSTLNKKENKTKKRRPGERNPQRDVIGGAPSVS